MNESIEVETRMLALEQKIVAQIKLWFFSGLFAVLVSFVGGFAGLAFYLGSMSNQFGVALDSIKSTKETVDSRERWAGRKDALDDDMIRFLETMGYKPPVWYEGNDSIALRK